MHKPRPLSWQLGSLILGLVIPTIIFVGILLWQLASSERSRIEDDTTAVSRGFAVALDREIHGVLTTLQALATSPSLQSRDFEAFYRQASEVARLQRINISLRDFSGRAMLTTRASFGADVAVPPVLAEMDQMVLRNREPMVTDIFTSSIAARPVFQILTSPVLVDGTPAFVLGASIDVEFLAEAIRREHLPSGWIGAIIDRKGVFVARSERHEELAGKAASLDFQTKARGAGGTYYGNNSDGRAVLVGYAKSSLTQWTTTASVPTDELRAPFRKSFLVLTSLGVGLVILAAAIALIMSYRIGNAFRRLEAAAETIGQGKAVDKVVTPISEINRVGYVLFFAADQLRASAEERDAAADALRKLNETLVSQVEEQTRERNRLWETTNDLVGTCTYEGQLVAINPAWGNHLDWTTEQILSGSLVGLLHPADRPAFLDVLASAKVGQPSRSLNNRMLCAGGKERSISWSVASDAVRELLYVVGRDVTEQRQAEELLRQSQKMDALGQLTGGVAHDFNNMLAVIIGTLNLMQRRLQRGDAAVEKYLDAALDGATRAATLTQRLLAFARQQPMSPQSIDANHLIAGMMELLNRTLGEQNNIETVLGAGLWRAMVDPSQLENVILNLAVNARDAMPDGGKLTIETSNTYVDEHYATDHEILVGQYVMIAMTDTGTGMSSETASKAFDPFFTTKEVGRGTGLGLSQVFGVARQSGGHVKIYSELGHGTTIKLYLPRTYKVAPEELLNRPVGQNDILRGTETILLVEDDGRVRDFAKDALHELGYTVVYAVNGADAISLVERGQEFDVLFTDVVMPEMTGRQLVDLVQVMKPGVKVLYMTGYSRNAIVHNGMLDPGTNLLTKPFGLDDLARKIRRTLDD